MTRPPSRAGGGVVRVAVELADEVQEVGGGHRASEEVVGGDGPSDECCGGTAEAAGGGDVVLLDEVEVYVRFADLVGDELRGPVGGVFGAGGDQVSARAVDLDARRGRPVQANPHA